MKTEITNPTEALIWALALASTARTVDQHTRATAEATHFAAYHLPSEVAEAKKKAIILARKWEAEKW